MNREQVKALYLEIAETLTNDQKTEMDEMIKFAVETSFSSSHMTAFGVMTAYLRGIIGWAPTQRMIEYYVD